MEQLIILCLLLANKLLAAEQQLCSEQYGGHHGRLADNVVWNVRWGVTTRIAQVVCVLEQFSQLCHSGWQFSVVDAGSKLRQVAGLIRRHAITIPRQMYRSQCFLYSLHKQSARHCYAGSDSYQRNKSRLWLIIYECILSKHFRFTKQTVRFRPIIKRFLTGEKKRNVV